MAKRLDAIRLTMPTITTPAIGRVNGSHGLRLSARCGPTVPVLGPVVVMVRVTVVALSPALICLSKLQAVSAGRFEQVSVTSLVKVGDPDGAALKAKVALCPASTVFALAPLITQVKSGGITVKSKVVCLGAGSPAVSACNVTVLVPVGVLPVVLTFRVTVTGFAEVGLTVFDGEK
jgi:hypothetical protein